MVSSSGYFGYTFAYQDPLVQAQREVTYKSDIQQNKPIPQPYARANIDIFTPDNWGPEIGGAKILDQIRLSILGSWSSGNHFTWTGGGAVKSGFLNNFQWRDAFNVDLRISKTIYLGPVNVELFADIYNALNIKYMSYYRAGFRNQDDYDKYMQSLHLPADKVKDFNSYGNIPGNDTPGDYRDPSVSYQPLEYANNIQSVTNPNTVAYYYDAATGSYYQWSGQSWSYVRSSVIEDVLNKKAYIDMPNLSYMTFLGPRNVFFGIKLNVNL